MNLPRIGSRLALISLFLVSGSLADKTRAEEPSKPLAKKDAHTDRYGDPLPPGSLLRIGTTRFRHGRTIETLVFSPRGDILASVGDDPNPNTFRLWDARTGKRLLQLEGITGPACMVFSPDGSRLAVSEWNGTISIRAVRDGREMQRLSGQRGPLSCLTYSHDSRRLASAGTDATSIVWDLTTGKQVLRIRPKNASAEMIWRLAFAANDKLLTCGGKATAVYGFWQPEFVQCWNVSTGKKVWERKGPEHSINFAAFGPDGGTVIYGGQTDLSCEQTAPSKLLGAVHMEDPDFPGFLSFALSLDGKSIASASWGGTIQLWDASTLKERKRLSDAGNHITALAFSSDGKFLASAANGIIRLWDTRTGKRIDSFQGQEKEITCLTFTRHGKWIVSAVEGTIGLWDAVTGEPVRRLEDEGSVGMLLALSPDERLLASADEGISIWEMATGRFVYRIPIRHGWVGALGFLDGNRLLSAEATLAFAERSGCWIALWDTTQQKQTHRVALREGQEREITPRAISPDGRILVTSSYVLGISSSGPCPPVYLWEVAQGRRLRQIGGQTTGARLITFSTDGKMLATAGWSEHPLWIWEVLTGRERLQIPREKGEAVSCIAFSPCGRLLALGDSGGDIHFWDLASGKKRGTFTGHGRRVSCLSFSPQGRLLVSGSEDTTILVWDMASMVRRGSPTAAKSGKGLSTLWTELADADPAKAYRALWGLVAVPDEAVPLLAKSLSPVTSDDVQVKRLIADLGNDDFSIRKAAMRELKELGELAWPALQDLLKSNPDLEVRRRAQQLLEEPIPPPAPKEVRALRAVEALELMGTQEARETLRKLAGGARGAPLTREAKASLERLRRRGGPKSTPPGQ
jgi:WD40 repeat protein